MTTDIAQKGKDERFKTKIIGSKSRQTLDWTREKRTRKIIGSKSRQTLDWTWEKRTRIGIKEESMTVVTNLAFCAI